MPSRSRRLLIGVILAATAIAYYPSLDHPFLFDDEVKILKNPALREPSRYLFAFGEDQYSEDKTRIIPNLTFALDYAIGELRPWVYNLTNLLIHLLNVWLVSRLGRALLRRFGTPSEAIPLLGAAIFALNPLNSEAVLYGNARPNMLCGTFYMLSLLNLLRAVEAEGRPQRVRLWRWIALGATLLATLLSKELGATLVVTGPLLLAWIGAVREGRYQETLRRLLILTGLMLVVGVAVGFLTGTVQGVITLTQEGTAGGTLKYVIGTALVQSRVFLAYLLLALFPFPSLLNVDHLVTPYERMGAGLTAFSAFCLLFLAIAAVALVRSRRRFPFPTFFLLWPFIVQSPNSIFPRKEAMVEYRSYIAMIGICLALAWAIDLALKALSRRTQLPPAAIHFSFAGALGIAFLSGVIVRAKVWESALILWTDSVTKSPRKGRPNYNMGVALFKKGKVDESIEWYRRALDHIPDDTKVHNGLATALGQKGEYEEAFKHFAIAERLEPKNAEVYNNRGAVRGQKGEHQAAMKDYTIALELNPFYLEAWNNRGIVKANLNDLPGALADYDKALSLYPNVAETHNNRGAAHASRRDYDRAIADYTTAIRLNPRYLQAWINRASSREQKGDKAGAIADFTEAIRLNPYHFEAFNARGAVRAGQGDPEGALADYNECIRLNAGFPIVYANRALIRNGKKDRQGAISDLETALKMAPPGWPQRPQVEQIYRKILAQP